eukprot:CAMPEP_0180572866 /NCGR_PEP_ID=MMETSP1037_2-20121125/9470_1 /TAXON_ID=632150 /ORGANISM="Azadinium spinosum, Strain 3D9" /LENGTH=158 /DNA_ID=CAMNT_0022590257 /DNA_START=263 /DNA_END=741 /DNA_ORIENTATION=+
MGPLSKLGGGGVGVVVRSACLAVACAEDSLVDALVAASAFATWKIGCRAGGTGQRDRLRRDDGHTHGVVYLECDGNRSSRAPVEGHDVWLVLLHAVLVVRLNLDAASDSVGQSAAVMPCGRVLGTGRGSHTTICVSTACHMLYSATACEHIAMTTTKG